MHIRIMANDASNTDLIISNSLKIFSTDLSVELKKAALESKVADTFALIKSIKTTVSGNALRLNFNEYGRFVDMGVGKGVPLGSKGSDNFTKYRRVDGKLKFYGRKPRTWYSKTAYSMLGNLKGSIYRNLSDALKSDIKNQLENKIL